MSEWQLCGSMAEFGDGVEVVRVLCDRREPGHVEHAAVADDGQVYTWGDAEALATAATADFDGRLKEREVG